MNDYRIIEVAFASPDYAATVALRDRILSTPLGIVITPEERAAEAGDHHIAAFRGDELVACLVLTPLSNEQIKMRQVAVSEQAQRQGIGTRMVEFCERFAAERGYRWIVLNARDTAVPFYLRLDYEVFGEPFTEVTIPHRKMRKQVDSLYVDG